MSDDHSARAGSLNAHLTSVKMEIDDDDEDIIQVVVDVVNESSIPIGGLQAAIVDAKGTRYEATEGISSIGPGLTRQFKFEAHIHSGTWTFEFNGGGQAMKLGPYEADFEYAAEKGRVLGNAIGSSLFSGAFDNHLGDFGNTEERGIIDASSVVMTSYVGENMEGGGTKVLRGDAAEEEDGPRTPPWATSPEPAPLTPLEAPSAPAEPTPLTPLTPPAAEAAPTSESAADPLLTPLTPVSEATETTPEPPASSPPPVPPTAAPKPPSGPPSGPPSVWSSEWSSFGTSIWSTIRSSKWSPLRSPLWPSKWPPERSSIRSAFRPSQRPSLRSPLWPSKWPSLWSAFRPTLPAP